MCTKARRMAATSAGRRGIEMPFRLGELVRATFGALKGTIVKVVGWNGQGSVYIQPAEKPAGFAEDVVPESTLEKIGEDDE